MWFSAASHRQWDPSDTVSHLIHNAKITLQSLSILPVRQHYKMAWSKLSAMWAKCWLWLLLLASCYCRSCLAGNKANIESGSSSSRGIFDNRTTHTHGNVIQSLWYNLLAHPLDSNVFHAPKFSFYYQKK